MQKIFLRLSRTHSNMYCSEKTQNFLIRVKHAVRVQCLGENFAQPMQKSGDRFYPSLFPNSRARRGSLEVEVDLEGET